MKSEIASRHSFRFEFKQQLNENCSSKREEIRSNTSKKLQVHPSALKLGSKLIPDHINSVKQNESQLDNNLDAMYWSKRGTIQALLVRFHNQKDRGILLWSSDNQAIRIVHDISKTTKIHVKQTELPFKGANLIESLNYPYSLFKRATRTIQNTRKEADLHTSYPRKTLSQIIISIVTLLFMFLQESKQQSMLTSTKLWPSSREAPTQFFAPPLMSSSSPKFTKFSSSRHISPRTSFLDNSSSSPTSREADEKILHNSRLINLKRLLDSYSYSLSSGANNDLNSRQMTQLGSGCLAASDCNKSVPNSHCNLDSFTCTCLPNHIEHNSTTCLPPSLLGYECLVDAQCQKKVQNSFCLNKLCACPSEFVAYRKDKCLAASKINDYCLTDKQCELNDKHSYCKWKIQHVYGLCKCPPNYKHISVELARPSISNSTGNVTSLSKEGQLSAVAIRCAPRLGDTCFEHSECQLGTPNSHCKEAPNNLKISWQTSRASSSKRCQCSENFLESHDRMSCVAQLDTQALSKTTPAIIEHSLPTSTQNLIQNATPAPIVTMLGGSNMDAKHHYELVTSSVSSELSSVPTSSTTTTTLVPISNNNTSKVVDEQQMKNQSENTNQATSRPGRVRVSSLGKTCRSKVECQLRDPHSDCINGICECKKPTEKCSAKSTGCHRDTFQCRNGQCISWYFVCDQFKNCDDGSDEDECLNNSCPNEAFKCDNGNCIARGKICNGKWDCQDGSDERFCFVNIKQKEANFIANVSSNSNMNKEQQQQQLDTKSEQDKCDSRAFTCANGQCLPAYVFCNAVEDCTDGSDERAHFCEANSLRKWPVEEQQNNQLSPSSSNHQFQNVTSLDSSVLKSQLANKTSSNSGVVTSSQQSFLSTTTTTNQDSPLLKTDRDSINKMLAALNVAQLAHRNRNNLNKNRGAKSWLQDNNNNEEIFGQRTRTYTRRRDNRIATTPSYNNHRDDQQSCPNWSFTCQNGKCRSSAILCSGIDGCGDNSDENRCEVCQCEAP